MTTAFQFVFDNAETISVNNKKVVGQTATRNGVVRSVSRGNTAKTIVVKLPDGMRWSDISANIAAMDAADKFAQEIVTTASTGYNSWLGNTNSFGSNINVTCVSLPQWTVFARDQVSWDGPFVFAEVIV
jgi:hypothetical protein